MISLISAESIHKANRFSLIYIGSYNGLQDSGRNIIKFRNFVDRKIRGSKIRKFNIRKFAIFGISVSIFEF